MTNNLITIGKRVDSKDREDVQVDVLKLILTRLLICANSGGGKSWILRRLAELLFPIMPCIIFDWEGEFKTLREKFDFVLVGKGGETPADCRSAKLVILKLLELRASAVIDLSELTPADKHRYVRLACEAAINSPKELWRPTAFIFDEVHEVCPENGKGQSEAKQAVLAFPTKGRKRQFLSIFATQRLHKLALDARAEMLNRMIGMTFEPDDLKVAASILGIGREGMDKFKHEMRTMETGNFYAFGRAISLETIRLKVGPVQTSHESLHAKYGLNAPPPTAKIKAMLPQLADLPKQAEEALNTEADLRRALADEKRRGNELEQQFKNASKTQPDPEIKEVPVLTDEDRKLIERAVDAYEVVKQLLGEFNMRAQHIIDPLNRLETRAAQKFTALPQRGREPSKVCLAIVTRQPRDARTVPTSSRNDEVRMPIATNGSSAVTGGERKILEALIQYPAGRDRAQLTVLTGLKRSSRDKYLQLLRAKGFVNTDSDTVTATLEGVDALPDAQPLPSGVELQQYHLSRLPEGERAILQILIDAHPNPVSREELSEKTGYLRSSRDKYLQFMRAKQLITEPCRGMVMASENLFE